MVILTIESKQFLDKIEFKHYSVDAIEWPGCIDHEMRRFYLGLGLYLDQLSRQQQAGVEGLSPGVSKMGCDRSKMGQEAAKIAKMVQNSSGMGKSGQNNARMGQYRAKMSIKSQKPVFVVGISGSVAAGKTTLASILTQLLQYIGKDRVVKCVSTDHFLFDNATIEERFGMDQKGFPQTYRYQELYKFIDQCKNRSQSSYSLSCYSHEVYDIVQGVAQEVVQPDVLVIEGVIALQEGVDDQGHTQSLRDLIDWGIYVDANEELLWQWFLARFESMRQASMHSTESFFNQWVAMDRFEASQVAGKYWQEINLANLRQYIEPSKKAAHCVLVKGDHHSIDQLLMRY